MSTEHTAQLRITNTTANKEGVLVPKILSIKASKLKDYIAREIGQCNKKYTPNRSKEFDHLPLLSLWDLADTGEEVVFSTYEDLPKKTVLNSKGIPLLIIMPESAADDAGLNKFEHLDKKVQGKVREFVRTIPATPFRLA